MAADKEIALDLKLNIPPTVGELKNQFKQLEEQLEGTRKGTAEYTKALMELGAVKGELQNLEETIDRLNPQKQGEAIAGLAGGIAGMYAGATAAAELFGVQNEEIEKSILKIQAATAIAQSVQSTFEMVRHAGVLKYMAAQKLADIQTKASTAITRIFGITAASSWAAVAAPITIGVAAVAAFGLAIWALKQKFQPVSEYIDAFATRVMKLVRTVGHFMGLMDSEEEVAAEKSLNRRIETRKRAIAIAEAEGKDVYELKRRLLIDELNLLEKGSKEYADKLLEIQVLNAARRKFLADEQAKAEEEARKKAEEARKKALEAQRKREEEAYRKFMEQYKGMQDLEAHDELAMLMDDQAKRDAIKKQAFDLDMQLNAARITMEEERLAMEQANLDLQKQRDQEYLQHKIDTFSAIGQASGALADLLGRHTAAGKALALAQIALDTWTGVARTLANATIIPEPFGTIQKIASVTAIVAAGVMAAKNAMAVQVPGGSGGGSPRMSAAVPSAPSIGAVQQNTASTILNPDHRKDQRVVVVESDIRNTSNRVQTIESAAKVG